MTSKEALQRIKNFKVVLNNRSDDYEFFNPMHLYYDNELKIIEKDLEVLEILKYLIPSIERSFNLKQFNESGMLGTIVKDYFINNDITGKVKEWLNDK